MNLGVFGNTYLSVFKHVEDYLTADGYVVSGQTGGVTLLDAYPDDNDLKRIIFRNDATGASNELVLPILTIEQAPIRPEPFELGSKSRKGDFRILMTLFTETNLQRQQIVGEVYNVLTENDINYYDFDVDFSNPVVSGTLYLDEMNIIPVDFTGSSNPVLKYGYDISFKVSKLI